jgi:DNA repair exonuclease SbcCD ATPase subunit
VEPLLRIAEELERRDEGAAAVLLQVERLQAELEELRAGATAAGAFLATLPRALASRGADVRAAEEARAAAEARLLEAQAAQERARKEDERLAAARALQQAGDELREAELWLGRTQRELELLERQAEERRREASELEGRAAQMARQPRLARETAPPAPGLDGVLDWAARARGELLLARAGLATERDRIVRESTELVAGVLGESLAATSAAGVRERLARALEGG